jgi:sec-independent protein translocase protein TatC
MDYRDARSRTLESLCGLLIAWLTSLLLPPRLWEIISQPGISFQKDHNVVPPKIVDVIPIEHFSIIWVQLPLFCSFLLGWPWIVYRLWVCIAPGLSKKERQSAKRTTRFFQLPNTLASSSTQRWE